MHEQKIKDSLNGKFELLLKELDKEKVLSISNEITTIVKGNTQNVPVMSNILDRWRVDLTNYITRMELGDENRDGLIALKGSFYALQSNVGTFLREGLDP